MPDIIYWAEASVSRATALAPILVFLCGLATSVGPCTVQRVLAVSSLGGGRRTSFTSTATFSLGVVATYSLFGLVASTLGWLQSSSSLIYGAMAASLFVGAGITTWKSCVAEHAKVAGHAHCQHDDHGDQNSRPESLGAVFLVGAATSIVPSVCCTPIAAVILAYTTAVGKPLYGAMLLAVFALGHVSPLFLVNALQSRMTAIFAGNGLARTLPLISSTMMIVLGLFFAVQV